MAREGEFAGAKVCFPSAHPHGSLRVSQKSLRPFQPLLGLAPTSDITDENRKEFRVAPACRKTPDDHREPSPTAKQVNEATQLFGLTRTSAPAERFGKDLIGFLAEDVVKRLPDEHAASRLQPLRIGDSHGPDDPCRIDNQAENLARHDEGLEGLGCRTVVWQTSIESRSRAAVCRTSGVRFHRPSLCERRFPVSFPVSLNHDCRVDRESGDDANTQAPFYEWPPARMSTWPLLANLVHSTPA